MSRDSLREHFSANAADLIRLHRAMCGAKIAQRIMLECFKRRPKSDRINEQTVCNVLQELQIMIDPDGSVTIGKDQR